MPQRWLGGGQVFVCRSVAYADLCVGGAWLPHSFGVPGKLGGNEEGCALLKRGAPIVCVCWWGCRCWISSQRCLPRDFMALICQGVWGRAAGHFHLDPSELRKSIQRRWQPRAAWPGQLSGTQIFEPHKRESVVLCGLLRVSRVGSNGLWSLLQPVDPKLSFCSIPAVQVGSGGDRQNAGVIPSDSKPHSWPHIGRMKTALPSPRGTQGLSRSLAHRP